MRDALTPEQMAMWKAFRRLQPAGLERIAEILKRGFTAVANSFGASYEPDDFEPSKEKAAAAEATATPNQAAAIAAASLGIPDGQRNR